MKPATITLSILLSLGGAWVSRAADYQISAHAMHSENQVTEFSGNVEITGDDLQLQAELIRIDATTQLYQITGVPAVLALSRTATTLTITAEQIDYDANTKAAVLAGNGLIQQDQFEIRAPQLEYDDRAERIRARDGVSLREANIRAAGTTAEVTSLRSNLALILEGNPATFTTIHAGEEFTAAASLIHYEQDRGLVRLQGAAAANFAGEKITGEQITYDLEQGTFAAQPGTSGRVTAVITLP